MYPLFQLFVVIFKNNYHLIFFKEINYFFYSIHYVIRVEINKDVIQIKLILTPSKI